MSSWSHCTPSRTSNLVTSAGDDLCIISTKLIDAHSTKNRDTIDHGYCHRCRVLYSVGVAQICVACRCGSCSCFLLLYFCYVLILVPCLYPYSSSPTLHLYEKCFFTTCYFHPTSESECDSRNARIQKANPNAIGGTRESKRRIRKRCPKHKTKKCPSRPP